jgi:DNA-binding MarR family transcriptional regulator
VTVTSPAERPVLLITADARGVRASLEPTAWIVLEELALRARVEDGQVVAEESSRSIADSLGRSKDAVARALRQLVDRGLIERAAGRHGRNGQFLAVRYVIELQASGLRLASETWRPLPSPSSESSGAQPREATRRDHASTPLF